MRSSAALLFAVSITLLGAALIILAFTTHHDVANLQHRVSCLEHPHGESSIAGVLKTVNGKRTFVVTQPVHRTGC